MVSKCQALLRRGTQEVVLSPNGVVLTKWFITFNMDIENAVLPEIPGSSLLLFFLHLDLVTVARTVRYQHCPACFLAAASLHIMKAICGALIYCEMLIHYRCRTEKGSFVSLLVLVAGALPGKFVPCVHTAPEITLFFSQMHPGYISARKKEKIASLSALPDSDDGDKSNGKFIFLVTLDTFAKLT